MSHRRITIKLPLEVSAGRYAAITYAVLSVLDVAGLATVASVLVEDLATDPELGEAFADDSAHYTGGT